MLLLSYRSGTRDGFSIFWQNYLNTPRDGPLNPESLAQSASPSYHTIQSDYFSLKKIILSFLQCTYDATYFTGLEKPFWWCLSHYSIQVKEPLFLGRRFLRFDFIEPPSYLNRAVKSPNTHLQNRVMSAISEHLLSIPFLKSFLH